MKVDGIKRIWSNPLFTHLRRHDCPQCRELLKPVKTSKIVHSQSEEAKNFDFSSPDGYLMGNIKFIWTEFSCASCQKTFSVPDIRSVEQGIKQSPPHPDPQNIPLTHIQEIDEAGILYLDAHGNSTNISYHDARTGWRTRWKAKRGKPEYLCDRTESGGWKLIFHTTPQVTFYDDGENVALRAETLRKIQAQGFDVFDRD